MWSRSCIKLSVFESVRNMAQRNFVSGMSRACRVPCLSILTPKTSIERRSILFNRTFREENQRNGYYVPVKSKLQHPPRATPRAFEFWEMFLFKFPPHRAEKLFKCPHPRENYQITVLTFSVAFIMLLMLCM